MPDPIDDRRPKALEIFNEIFRPTFHPCFDEFVISVTAQARVLYKVFDEPPETIIKIVNCEINAIQSQVSRELDRLRNEFTARIKRL